MYEIDSIIKECKKECSLSKKYFHAVYKTKLLKYKGFDIPPKDYGNIISMTYAFEAKDIDDAKAKAPDLFNIHNAAFKSLIHSSMEVKHELLEIKEVQIPNIDTRNLRSITNNWKNEGRFITRMRNNDSSVPRSFLGFDNGDIIRKMPHFDSPRKDITYLYHPWQGASDNFTDWFEYSYRNQVWKIMDEFFNQRRKTDKDKFNYTQYTDLKRKHCLKVKELRKLEYLLSHVKGYGPDSQVIYDNINNQGYYYMQRFVGNNYELPTFIEIESNYWRMAYKTNVEKRIELETQISQLQNKLDLLKEELTSIK